MKRGAGAETEEATEKQEQRQRQGLGGVRRALFQRGSEVQAEGRVALVDAGVQVDVGRKEQADVGVQTDGGQGKRMESGWGVGVQSIWWPVQGTSLGTGSAGQECMGLCSGESSAQAVGMMNAVVIRCCTMRHG